MKDTKSDLKKALQKVASSQALSPSEWIIAGEAIFRTRKRQGWTQIEAAKKLGIGRRKLQRLEYVGRWSDSVKSHIRKHEIELSHENMKKLSDRSWSKSKDLKRAIDQLAEGKKLRKKRIRKAQEILTENGPDRLNEIHVLSGELKTRVDIQGKKQGQIVIYFHNWEQYDRIKESILK